MKSYGGDTTEMPIDVRSMVVKSESPRMKIHGGNITEMPIDENLWW